MENNLKLLMTEEDLNNLKKVYAELKDYNNIILKPLRDTFANEARRAINYNRKIEVAMRKCDDILNKIQLIIKN